MQYIHNAVLTGVEIFTVWPEILVGYLFWQIGGFESNSPIFLPPKFVQSYSFTS